MDYVVPCIYGRIKNRAAEVSVPGSKSITARALFVSALAKGTSTLYGAGLSDDCLTFIGCLKSLGIGVFLNGTTVTVEGCGGKLPVNGGEVYVGSAGTAARFITALLAFSKGEFTVTSSEQMKRRPMGDLISALKEAGVPYTVVPGANAALSALILSAMPSERFAFLGFLPDKQGERRRLLEKYAALDLTLIFHAAPQDVDRYIADMYAVFGDRPACAVREITKIHEEALSFTLKEGLPGEKRGEYVLIIGGAEEHNELNSLTEVEHIKHYMAQGLDKKEAIKRAAKDRGVAKSELYKFGIDL